MSEKTDPLFWANTACARIDRALRQEKRVRKAWGRLKEFEKGLPLREREMPREWVQKHEEFRDDQYFFVVAARQAVSATKVLSALGFDVPRLTYSAEITAWRDVEEHWDDPAVKGREINALQRWKDLQDSSEPGLTHSGGQELTDLSGIDIQTVRTELQALRVAAGSFAASEFDKVWMPTSAAADAFELTVAEFERRHAGYLYRLDLSPRGEEKWGEDLGIRYHVDSVDARLEGRPLPPEFFGGGPVA